MTDQQQADSCPPWGRAKMPRLEAFSKTPLRSPAPIAPRRIVVRLERVSSLQNFRPITATTLATTVSGAKASPPSTVPTESPC